MSDEHHGAIAPFSQHIFLFPFKWAFKPPNDSKAFKDRVDLSKFDKVLVDNHPDKIWQRVPFELNHANAYNEYMYFYDFAREIMYDFGASHELKTPEVNNEDVIRHFELNISNEESTRYIIETLAGHRFNLRLTDVLLNIYHTGIGVLSFHLENDETSDPDDILLINEFGRRLFPPFLDQANSIADVQKKMLAQKISLSIDDKLYEEDFDHYQQGLDHIKTDPLRLPAHIRELLGGKEANEHKNPFKEKEKDIEEGEFWIYPALDDRMFVISWYGHTALAEALSTFPTTEERHGVFEKGMLASTGKFYPMPEWEYGYVKASEEADFWYKYVFVDAEDKTCQNELMQEQQILKHTYARWIAYKSLYGITRYSLVALTKAVETENDFRLVPGHISSLYYKMVELVLVQRASTLRFSHEITRIADLSKQDEQAIIEQVSDLHQNFIRFRNKINFRAITAQDQGIEMYDMMRETMQIEQEVKDLDVEIEELHQYVSMIEQGKQTKKANSLTKLAAFFLPPTLLTGILGMNTMPETKNISIWLLGGDFFPVFWISFALVALMILPGWLLSYLITRKH